MVMGFSISASAVTVDDFTDKTEIKANYMAAVDLLTELQIINGMTATTFEPAGDLTRAQYAKMLFVIFNRGVDDGAVLYAGLPHKFVDVPNGAWFDGYVSWMHGRDWITGRNAEGTIFGPNDPVTGFEALKMSLVALGYDEDIESFTGDSWKNNVMNRAQDAGLLDGILTEDTLDKAIRRDVAAHILHNTLFATLVQYNQQYIPQRAEKVQMNAGSASTLAQQYYKLRVLTGVALTNTWASFGGPALNNNMNSSFWVRGIDDTWYDTANINNNVVEYNPLNTSGRYVQFEDELPLELLGHEVKIYARETVAPTTSTVGGYDRIYGTVKKTARSVETDKFAKTNVVNYNLQTVASRADLKWYASNSDDGLGDITAISPITAGNTDWHSGTFVNYKVVNGDTDMTVSNSVLKGSPITFIDNDGDGKYEFINARSYWYSKVDAVTEDDDAKVTAIAGRLSQFDAVRILNAVKSADIYNSADIKKDDRVLVYKIGGKFGVEQVPVTNGTLSATKDNSTIAVIDGTNYAEPDLDSRVVTMQAIVTNTENYNVERDYRVWKTWILEGPGAPGIEKKWALVLDSFVLGNGIGSTNRQVKLLLDDGTEKIYKLGNIYQGDGAASGNAYAINAAGGTATDGYPNATLGDERRNRIQLGAGSAPTGILVGEILTPEAGIIVKASVSADGESVTLWDGAVAATQSFTSRSANAAMTWAKGNTQITLNDDGSETGLDAASLQGQIGAGPAAATNDTAVNNAQVMDSSVLFAVKLYDTGHADAGKVSSYAVYKGRDMASFDDIKDTENDDVRFRLFQNISGSVGTIVNATGLVKPIVAASFVGPRVSTLGSASGKYAYVFDAEVKYVDSKFTGSIKMLDADGNVKTYDVSPTIRSKTQEHTWNRNDISSATTELLTDFIINVKKGNVIEYQLNAAGQISSLVTIFQYNGWNNYDANTGAGPYTFLQVAMGTSFTGTTALDANEMNIPVLNENTGHAFVGYMAGKDSAFSKIYPSASKPGTEISITKGADDALHFALDGGMKVYEVNPDTESGSLSSLSAVRASEEIANKVIAVTSGLATPTEPDRPKIVALFEIPTDYKQPAQIRIDAGATAPSVLTFAAYVDGLTRKIIYENAPAGVLLLGHTNGHFPESTILASEPNPLGAAIGYQSVGSGLGVYLNTGAGAHEESTAGSWLPDGTIWVRYRDANGVIGWAEAKDITSLIAANDALNTETAKALTAVEDDLSTGITLNGDTLEGAFDDLTGAVLTVPAPGSSGVTVTADNFTGDLKKDMWNAAARTLTLPDLTQVDHDNDGGASTPAVDYSIKGTFTLTYTSVVAGETVTETRVVTVDSETTDHETAMGVLETALVKVKTAGGTSAWALDVGSTLSGTWSGAKATMGGATLTFPVEAKMDATMTGLPSTWLLTENDDSTHDGNWKITAPATIPDTLTNVPVTVTFSYKVGGTTATMDLPFVVDTSVKDADYNASLLAAQNAIAAYATAVAGGTGTSAFTSPNWTAVVNGSTLTPTLPTPAAGTVVSWAVTGTGLTIPSGVLTAGAAIADGNAVITATGTTNGVTATATTTITVDAQ
jgi:hypothetical protein